VRWEAVYRRECLFQTDRVIFSTPGLSTLNGAPKFVRGWIKVMALVLNGPQRLLAELEYLFEGSKTERESIDQFLNQGPGCINTVKPGIRRGTKNLNLAAGQLLAPVLAHALHFDYIRIKVPRK
jgi:hypothetical protein